MTKRLIFGTAQFNETYGFINLKKKKISQKKIIEILNYLKNNKIYTLDTSMEYKNVDKKIKLSKYGNWKIITKVNLNRFKHIKSENKITNYLIKLVKLNASNLGVKKIEALLIHNVDSLFKPNGRAFFSALRKLKKLGYINKFGYSIYNFDLLEKIINNFKPDIIQCSYNIFDTRLNNKKIIKSIKKNKIEVHARSIFLQGLLLLPLKNLPKKFMKWKKNFKKWDEWTKKNNCSKLEVCMNFVKSNSLIDRIIFGVQDLNQLKQILKIKFKKKILLPSYFFSNDINLINPLKWYDLNKN